MKVLIVDDEPIARHVLREELEELSGVSVVGEAEDGLEAVRLIEDLRPDLVFLDLQMPLMGGFEVVRNLKGPKLPVIVIVTAFDQHAIEAFESGAVDYLLKPVSAARLVRAVSRARQLLERPGDVAEELAKIAAVPGAPASPPGRKIVGRSGGDYFLLNPDEVLAFLADGEVVWIVTSKNRLQATIPLHAIEARLVQLHFRRVHRGAIVNINHVRKMSALSSHRWLLTLSNQQQLTVSKRMARNIRELFS